MNPLKKLIPAGPVVRIFLRYAIGFLAAKGVIPDALGQMLTDSEPALEAIELGLCAVAGYCVERVYSKAKRLGWAL